MVVVKARGVNAVAQGESKGDGGGLDGWETRSKR